ncbi:SusC/RagA family TonB-linked outer membrane protein [Flavobacterium sp. AS60]|uniref:SusC/RagA family TonB-linked outer membrane protein n=1 Tax=Flavobacterium anseongense TaxID=2910677 RepID=UPI001F360B31|nr:SusC/RagA family TonB-linked outer membrane protein [Flavobacterium sp. AS60]MCF6130360.1 SusC/RagA family TonB-linked outer membrane protein [Flavobacterium sp. AS60]
MKTKLNGFLTLFIALLVQISFAQDRVVSGVVSDNSGLPIPGVNVLVKGTSTGVQTDIDGKYSIKADATQTLVFNFVGMKSQEIVASSTTINVKMKEDAVELEGVVVTALGITREKKSLGYAAQKLSGDEINQVPTNNFTNSLSGRVAGLEVRRNSNFGGSTNIVLRGTKSISGNNQALIVLDGVPITNTNLNTRDAANGRDGFDFGNSASDIDPNNIESLTVLKGAAATALYGSQAANGAIMITTKKGKQGKGMGITYSSTTSIGMINKETFPTYQNKYGEGYAGPDSFFVEDVDGDGNDDFITPTGDDASYGNEFDPNLNVYQWNSFVEGNPNFGQATPWVAAKNDPSKFFNKSFGSINSININGGDDKSTYNFGFTNNYETGTLPNSRLNRNVINGNFSRNLSEKLRVTAFLTYSDQTTIGRNNLGYGDNIMTGFRQWWPVNVDIKELQREYSRTNTNATWNFADPLGGDFTPAYWNNPYWDRYQNYSSDDRTRVIIGSSLILDVTKDLNILGRVTVESSNDRQEMRKAIGSHAEEFGISQINETSGYNLYTRSFLQSTYDFITTYDKRLTNDLGIKILGGTSFIKASADEFEGSTTGGLASPGLFTLANSNVFIAPVEEEYRYEKFGIYGQVSFDYKKALYLEGSYRLDNSTALPKNNDTYGYYSLGTSFVFSQFAKIDWLSLGKIRLSYAEVGNDPAFGTLGARVNNGLVGSNPTFGNSTVFVDFEKLKPELQKTWEFGIEAEMFSKRLNFDLSVYKTNTFNQIFNVPQSTSTGYSFSQINAGELQNKGIEIALSGYPIKTTDFKWMVGVNWSKNKNELIKLDEGRSNLQLASFQDGVSLNATVGEPYGTLRGTDFVYDDNGNRVIDADGFYLTDSDKVIGNIQADWIAGITNRFTYKNLTFNFLIDIKQGGDVFSLDQSYGQYTGIYAESAGNNDLGNPLRDPLTGGADSGGVILPGVLEDGTPNNIRIDASTAGAAYGSGAAPNKAFIYDASYVKLREIGLTYNFSSKILEKTFITGASIGITGTNLWIIDKKLPHADPEAGNSAGNVQGYQSGVMPSEKVYAFNVKINF